MKVTLSARARRDLDGIWSYTAERWSEAQAERYIRQFGEAFSGLAAGTLAGRDASGVRAGYRKLIVGSHLVFYRTQDASSIEVVRILHQAMDIERHL